MKNLYKKLCFILASAFGVGYCPKMSGTVTSFVTLPFVFLVSCWFGALGILIVSLCTFFIGVMTSKEVLKYTKHDPSLITIDEVLGQFMTFSFVAFFALTNTSKDWWIYLLGFALFRLFDIVKPQLIGWADKKLENAWGVMLDDLFASVYAGAILSVLVLMVEALLK